MQKYWSGIACYTAITIDYLDLTNVSGTPWKRGQNNELHADFVSFLFDCARKNAFFGVRAEMLLFSGFVQKYYCPESVEILILGTCVRRCWFRKGLALSNGNTNCAVQAGVA